jgi:hypothetical protein
MILPSPSTVLVESESEQQYFSLFRDRTAAELAPFFESQTWRRLLLQACSEPAIRHAVLAISALHKTSMTVRDHQSLFFDGNLTEANLHHQHAILHYSKAIRIMRDAAARGNQDLRTILLTSLVIICFESFHGNYALADAQVQTAIVLIEEWKASFPNGNQIALGFSSPAPDIIEDELIQIFGRLDIQTISFVDKRPLEYHKQLRTDGSVHISNMPPAFRTVDEARIYLDLIMRRVEHFLYVWGALLSPPSVISQDDTEPQSTRHSSTDVEDFSGTSTPESTNPNYRPQNRFPNLESVGVLDSADYNSIAPLEIRVSGAVYSAESSEGEALAEEALANQTYHLSEVTQWNNSFEAFLQQKKEHKSSASGMLLRLHYLTTYFALLSALSLDAMVYDDYTAEMSEIVTLSQRLVDILKSRPDNSRFSFDLGVIIPLYLIGLRCRVSSIRAHAIHLLLSWPRREGIWDSIFAGKIAQWVQQIEEEHLEGKHIPDWARVRRVGTAFDLQKREAELSCQQGQRTPEGIAETQRSTMIAW